MTPAEKRIMESTLFADVVTRLGISATGNEPRFDSDAGPSSSTVAAPTKRLRTVLSRADLGDFDDVTNMSFGSDGETTPTPLVENVDVAVASLNTSSQSNRSDVSLVENRSDLEASASNAQTEQTSHSSSSRKRNFREVQMENSLQLNEQMAKNNETIALQQRYLQLQVERAEMAKDREVLQKRLLEIEVEKMDELKGLEIEKRKLMNDMELEAMRRNLNLPPNN